MWIYSSYSPWNGTIKISNSIDQDENFVITLKILWRYSKINTSWWWLYFSHIFPGFPTLPIASQLDISVYPKLFHSRAPKQHPSWASAEQRRTSGDTKQRRTSGDTKQRRTSGDTKQQQPKRWILVSLKKHIKYLYHKNSDHMAYHAS